MTEWFLHKKEYIVHRFSDLNIPLFLTNRRIVFTKDSWGSMVFNDISLKHLSSVEAKKDIIWWAILAGIFTIIIGYMSMVQYIGNAFGSILFILGLALAVAGILCGPKEIIFGSDSGNKIRVSLKNREQIKKIIKTVREHE